MSMSGFSQGEGLAREKASGGKVSHLESRLRMRFAPRSSGQITSAFKLKLTEEQF